MMKKEEMLTMRAIAICFKPYLKPEEALIYTNLGRTQFAKKCKEHGIYKNTAGYYSREALDSYMGGDEVKIVQNEANSKR
ncbi:hypothetical protein L3C95_31745 [Chitinophaga filiformis]|uniref:hypothetical protein n=1 Tax=Chitinophaga filiformis TaxID=104663 RepID=UPI001F2DEC95|nr:hypothetical protein [Chitinophaga filiformis]MCF6407508.1 hypothetical protein [Chitinophaga filiformis]